MSCKENNRVQGRNLHPPTTPHKMCMENSRSTNPSRPKADREEAFSYYHSQDNGEKHILRQLLAYNYPTDGKSLYYLGTTGIPMGLPLAPELARMYTAYHHRNYETPPNEKLTVYFDDVASTFPSKTFHLHHTTLNQHHRTLPRIVSTTPLTKNFYPSNRSTANQCCYIHSATTHLKLWRRIRIYPRHLVLRKHQPTPQTA